MKRILGSLIVGVALIAAGCSTTSIMDAGDAGSAALLPDGAPGLSAQLDYTYRVDVEYLSRDYDDSDGDDIIDVSTFIVGLTYYLNDGIKDTEMPYALQPYMQRASYASVGIGMGDWEIFDNEGDARVFKYAAAMIDADSGLGIKLESYYEKGKDFDSGLGVSSFTEDRLAAALVWQDADGLAVEIGVVKASADVFIDDLTIDTFSGFMSAYRSVTLEGRKVFTFGDQALDANVHLEFGKYNLIDAMAGDDDGGKKYGFGVTYYPIKELGVGFDFTAFSVDADDANAEDLEYNQIALNVTGTIAERYDVGISYKHFENDVDDPDNTNTETTKIGVTVGVRF